VSLASGSEISAPRVPAVYLAHAILAFLTLRAVRGMNNLRELSAQKRERAVIEEDQDPSEGENSSRSLAARERELCNSLPHVRSASQSLQDGNDLIEQIY
jgi:hypothetical protein